MLTNDDGGELDTLLGASGRFQWWILKPRARSSEASTSAFEWTVHIHPHKGWYWPHGVSAKWSRLYWCLIYSRSHYQQFDPLTYTIASIQKSDFIHESHLAAEGHCHWNYHSKYHFFSIFYLWVCNLWLTVLFPCLICKRQITRLSLIQSVFTLSTCAFLCVWPHIVYTGW